MQEGEAVFYIVESDIEYRAIFLFKTIVKGEDAAEIRRIFTDRSIAPIVQSGTM